MSSPVFDGHICGFQFQQNALRQIATADGIRTLKVNRKFHDNSGLISFIAYSNDGKLMCTSAADDSMHVYDCDRAQRVTVVNSKKYGVAFAQFNGGSKYVVHASTKENRECGYL